MACPLYTQWSVELGPDYSVSMPNIFPQASWCYVEVWFGCGTCKILLTVLHSMGLFSPQDFKSTWSSMIFLFSTTSMKYVVPNILFCTGESFKMLTQIKVSWGVERNTHTKATGKHPLWALGKNGVQHFIVVLHSSIFRGKSYKIKTCPRGNVYVSVATHRTLSDLATI